MDRRATLLKSPHQHYRHMTDEQENVSLRPFLDELIEQDLPTDTREKVLHAGKEASISDIWRIGGTRVATVEGSD
jgi:hypothetical protein